MKKSIALLLLAGCAAHPTKIIDTHIHLYDPTRPQGVPWPSKNDPILYRPILPAEYRALARANGVAGAVVVEASPLVDDNQWVLDLVKDDPFFVGVVGNLQPGMRGFAANLDRFRLVGIRARVDPSKPGVIDDLKELARRRMSLDLLLPGTPLEQVLAITRQVPDLTIVLDHLAGAKVDGRRPDPTWIAQLKEVAASPSVFVKLSALDQQAGAARSLDHYRPVLDILWEVFGEDRLVYGSNWPVTLLRTDFATHQAWVLDWARPKGQAALDKLFWRNAIRAYRLAS